MWGQDVDIPSPVDALGALETTRALQFVVGDQPVKRLYSDNRRSIRKACHMLRIPWEASQPGIHQTNARVERSSRDILDGTRVALVQVGLPSLFLAICSKMLLPQ